MPFDTPHIEFLKDIKNYVALGSLTLEIHENSNLGGDWEENFLNRSSAFSENSDVHKTVWSLLCLGWIRVFSRKHPQDECKLLVRVYVLPADVGRRFIERIPRDWHHLQKLMNHLNTSEQAWEGTASLDHLIHDHYDSHHQLSAVDNDSLFYIFNTLPSPSPSSSNISCPFSRNAMMALLDRDERLFGLKTELYAYQRRSAAMMIRREVEPIRALDPRLAALRAPDGKEFYHDRTTGLVLRHPRLYEEARGGILAETMGLGKTLICLAVVLSTQGHWPQVPVEYSLSRELVRPEVGSLMQMAAAATTRRRIPWKSHFLRLGSAGEDYQTCVSLLEQYCSSYTIPPPAKRRSSRPNTVRPGKLIHLCSATLVIVPLNLFSHWKDEITMHVEQGCMKVLYVEKNETTMPTAKKLLTFDLILISKGRFEEEMSLNTNLKSTCECTGDRCRCSNGIHYHSPLEELHFLRIIVDEGHDFSSFGRKKNAVHVLQRLHVERRWVVSGTPSSGLLGVEVSTATLETLDNVSDLESSAVRDVLESRRVNNADAQLDPGLQRSTLLQERKDLEKLGSIVEDFLNLKPWSNDKGGEDAASWKQYIIPSDDGRRKTKSLRSVLESLVVRHRVEDIEKDIKLPPLHNKTIYLQPKWQDKLSINLFILTLTANAVTSERVDQDYMFHPKNRGSLNQLISNLRQSGFYWTSFTPHEIRKTIDVSRKYLESKYQSQPSDMLSGNLREGDLRLLKQAVEIGETVLSSPSWLAFAKFHELGVFVEHFPKEAQTAWSLVDHTEEGILVIGASQLDKAQTYIDNHLYASDPANGLASVGQITMQKLSSSTKHEEKAAFSRTNIATMVSDNSGRHSSVSPTSTRKPLSIAKRTTSRVNVGSIPQQQTAVSQLIKSQPIVGTTDASREITSPHKPIPPKSAMKTLSATKPVDPFTPESTLSKTNLCGTASAKLSYILDQVIKLHRKEKIIIFYEGDNIAFYIAQAFELLGLRFLIYTGSLTVARKSAYITTFNKSEAFRVLLMDVHQAAHGLHIAAASRVFFVNPVWQPTVEAQAIKRAHRIGQKRSVFVETLVLKDTLEDRMLQRRKSMSAQEHYRAEKSLLDDDVMEQLIKDAQFIPLLPEEMNDVRGQMAKLQSPQKVFGSRNAGINSNEDPDADLIYPELSTTKRLNPKRKIPSTNASGETPTSKKTVVAFAS